jgi:NAD(P)-dependent dehydrogenase (short-subunit alcohol dehydrogenase family)
MSFAGKLIAVTGAASGIGRATAELLVKRGAYVVALDRRRPTSTDVGFVEIDLADRASIDGSLATLQSTLHGLVNVAGVPGSLDGETVMRVNLLGLRHLTEAVLPHMAPGGAIVNVASCAGTGWRAHLDDHLDLMAARSFDEGLAWVKAHPMSGPDAYNFSKEAVIVYGQVASMIARPYFVRVNTVNPGAVETPILTDFYATMDKAILDRLKAQAGGRDGRPSEIAPAVCFLLSDEAGWINGTELNVDGGAEVAINLGLLDVEPDQALAAVLDRVKSG